ncbi:alpha-1,3-mannosyl-glycoprotein 4-beta-N-acetylglucosaminyltransferase-like protein MGAT4E [Nannospalax galili]|uniref:alpha-1,3-mannosyl-glycoprotein 4-beta-N-acetylglucosaminyltransferase-like protein MGAT4E n=1 Tax=Nannospalax galili TaxID=1026970 RepID=UPI0004ED058D|nr:alpha-1,3-mannosyl-glycoprotein 4-beta-N-acetylglucosaminyltransferase-like protein MGAT4E [Nannospalax galili]
MMLQTVQEQVSSEIKNHSKDFKEMQKWSPLLQHASYALLAGASPQEKKLLTVGISSVLRPYRSYLLDTLQSLFQASSQYDLDYILVLVLLSDTEPAGLNETVARISHLFMTHIEAGRLLVVHGLLDDPLVKNRNHFSPCGELYSRQKTDSALLMNFAHNLSDYFLLLEDNVLTTPRFVSAIYWALSAWEAFPWVILEFSSLRSSGKVFHTRDLSHLTSFFLLFPKDTPTHSLLSESHLLLNQNVPIHFSFSIFHHMGSYSELEDTCFPMEKDMVFGEPNNPAATIFTNMISLWNTAPQYAYILNDDCFWVIEPEKDNYVLVILDRPQKIIRIAVLTGSDHRRMNHLQHRQVLLGYSLMDYPKRCAHYTLVGPLVRGHLDQRVFYEEDSVKKMSCMKLLVSAPQDSSLLIRHIKVWTEQEEEES